MSTPANVEENTEAIRKKQKNIFVQFVMEHSNDIQMKGGKKI